MKAEEFLKENYPHATEQVFEILEAYAKKKVLEALRKETPKAYDKGNNDVNRWHNAKTVGKKYYKTEVEPKYK